jgi:hypothetical protein
MNPEHPFQRAMTTEPENLVLQLLRGLRTDVAKLDAKLDETRAELKTEFKAELRAEINSLRADVASDMLAMEKRTGEQILALQKQTGEQIEGLRQTLVHYHSAVVGHGFLISDLDARVRRVERHLELPPLVDS